MTVPLGNPFTLGATGVTTSARYDRLALGATWRPSSAALGAASGFLIGPANTMGELTLVSDTLLRAEPFLACIQGTHNTLQGQYLVPNTAQRDLAVPAKDATLSGKALVVVRVADSLEAGVASSPTTDGAWLEIIPGALAASNPVPPATPANALLAGELTIPSVASGSPVTLTKYNPRTGPRGGVLPVIDDASTIPGHAGAPGAHLGEYRDHPTLGLQRWTGTAWSTIGVGGDTGWIGFTPIAPLVAGPTGCAYRVRNGLCSVVFDVSYNGSYDANFAFAALPVAARPSRPWPFLGYWYGSSVFTPVVIETTGSMHFSSPATATHTGAIGSTSYLVG